MIFTPQNSKMVYAVEVSVDDDETYKDVCLVVSPNLQVAERLARKASDFFGRYVGFKDSMAEYMEKWEKKNPEPRGKPRLGKATPDVIEAIAKEKKIWSEWQEKYDAELAIYKSKHQIKLDEEEMMFSSLLHEYLDNHWEAHFGVKEIIAIE